MLLPTQTSSNTTATRATIAETDYLFGGKFGAQNFAKGMLELKIATESRGRGNGKWEWGKWGRTFHCRLPKQSSTTSWLAAETGALTVGSQASRQTSGTEDRHTCAPKTFDATLSAVTSVVGWRVKFMQPSKMHGSNQVQAN